MNFHRLRKLHLLAGCAFAAPLLLAPAAASAGTVPYTTVSLSYQGFSYSITPLMDGNKLWDTTLSYKNTTGNPLAAAYFVFLADEFYDPGPAAEEQSTWNNSLQQWVYNSPTLSNAYAKPVNASTFILMEPLETNISYPASVASDSLPAYLMGTNILPGQTVTFDIKEELSPNITASLGPSYALVSTTPEPAAWALSAVASLLLLVFSLIRDERDSKLR